ncbi:MAG: PASTA domain-containing protein [Clostridia bacterium]|nr:PASTA domain-containing protein [Clostridia bacterium]
MQRPFTLHSLQKRILAITILISFIFCLLFVRLFFIQIINGKKLQTKATDQWTRDLTLVAPRGTIYDTTGAALAVSHTTYNVYVRAREVENPSYVSSFLCEVLDLKFSNVYEKVTKKNISEVLIKMQVDIETAEKIYNKNLSGVFLAESVGRYYVYGDLLTQLLGFVSVDNVGQSGIEAYYNDLLCGQDGYSYVQSDLQGKEISGKIRYYIPGVKGSDLYLSIDSKIQLTLEQTLEKIMVEQSSKSVTGMVMKAETGELVALSSKPSFDLNEIPRDDLETLFSSSKVKAVTDTYEPGSTFKILTVASALEEGETSFEDRFYCPGYRMVDGQRIKCWKTSGHGSQTLVEAFANSCNCCFMDLALRLGKDRFYDYLERFGLGKSTGISISGESGGILMKKENVKNVDLARIGFGHAVAVTPIQLMSAVSAITNGGDLFTPSIVKKSVDNKGKETNLINTSCKKVISQKTSNSVNFLLEKATNKTGDFTFVEGYNVGGKTGTAQKYDENGRIATGKYISSFIGTYPANKPEYIVFIMVDEPSAGAYYGSIVAAPYGKEVFGGIFNYLDIQKQKEDVNIEEVIMPDLVGKSLSEGGSELKKIGIFYEVDGEGGIILNQLPPAGTTLKKGDTVILIT